jgi:hypothetical protein
MRPPVGDPLFLTGFPKSGTTLLLSLLDGHPDLNVFPKETLFFPYALADLESDRERGVELFVERIFEGVLFGLEEVVKDKVGTDDYKNALRKRWAKTDYALSRFLDIAVETYGELIGRSGRRYWVEKTPHTELHVPTLYGWYPTIKVIHCVRDPRANYAAIRTWNEREGRPTSFPRFASQLKRSWAAAKRNGNLLSQITLRYEDFVEDTEHAMRQVCDFLEVEFDGTLLEPTLGGEPFKGNSMYKSSFSGVSRASLDRWRSVLSPEDIREVEWLLGPEFDEMGYERTPGRPPLSSRSLRSHLALEIFQTYDHLPGSWKSGFRYFRGGARPD